MLGMRPWSDTLLLNMGGLKPYVDERYANIALHGMTLGGKYVPFTGREVDVQGEQHLVPLLEVQFTYWSQRAEVAAMIHVSDRTARKHIRQLADRNIVKTDNRDYTSYVFNPNMHEWDLPEQAFEPHCFDPDSDKYAPVWRICPVERTHAMRVIGFAPRAQVTDVRQQIVPVGEWVELWDVPETK